MGNHVDTLVDTEINHNFLGYGILHVRFLDLGTL
jgi:hypothetical protein